MFVCYYEHPCFPGSSAGKESACNAGDPNSTPGSGRSPEEGIGYPLQYSWASLVAQTVKNLPAVQKTWVRSLGWEDPQEKGRATHSSILAGRIPTNRGAWWATESDTTERLGVAQHSTRTSTGNFPWCLPVLVSQMQIAGWEPSALPDVNKITPKNSLLKLSDNYHCINFVAEYIKQPQVLFLENMIIILDVLQVLPLHTHRDSFNSSSLLKSQQFIGK